MKPVPPATKLWPKRDQTKGDSNSEAMAAVDPLPLDSWPEVEPEVDRWRCSTQSG